MVKIELSLDKGVYSFIKCYSNIFNIGLDEAVCELIRFFRLISGDEVGLRVLEEIVGQKQYVIPILGDPVKIGVELDEQGLEYVVKVSKILGVSIDNALKVCILTLAGLLQRYFPNVKCRLRRKGYTRFRLPNFKVMVRSYKSSVGAPE